MPPSLGSYSDRLEQLTQHCRDKRLPLTAQRRTIFEAVLRRVDHPTAEHIYHDVKRELPSISRTTVYRVLETLAQWELLHRISHPGSSVRFDPNTGHHHHLICEVCQKLRDLEASAIDYLTLPRAFPDTFLMRDYSIYFSGICGECQHVAQETQ